MKLSTLATLVSLSFILILSGCGTPKPNPDATIDSSLPQVELTANGIKKDMKSIALEWKAFNDKRVKGIYIYRMALDNNKSEIEDDAYYVTIDNRFSTHFLDTRIQPNSRYSYYFKTYSALAEGLKSAKTVVRSNPILDSVTWIHALKDMPRSAKIIWRPHTNKIVNGYEVKRRTLKQKEWESIAILDGRLRAEYIDTGLADKYTYIYVVHALTYNNIISKPSKEVQITTKARPPEVRNIKATDNQPKKIILTWQKSDLKDFLKYNIYRSKSADGGYTFLAQTKTNKYIDKIDEDGVRYFYRVSVLDKDALESNYELYSAQGVTVVKPNPPALVEAKIVDNTIVLRWNKTDDRAKTYIVSKRYKKGMFDEVAEEFDGITSLSYIDKKIQADTTYYFKVYAVDKDGIRSNASIEIELETKPSAKKPKEVKDI